MLTRFIIVISQYSQISHHYVIHHYVVMSLEKKREMSFRRKTEVGKVHTVESLQKCIWPFQLGNKYAPSMPSSFTV